MAPHGYGSGSSQPQFYHPGHADIDLAQAAEQSLHIGQNPQASSVGVGNVPNNGIHCHPGMHANSGYADLHVNPEPNNYSHIATNGMGSGQNPPPPTGKNWGRAVDNVSAAK
ncbi:hypothetical protein GGI23_003549 [Coemansia sp. RSA 2559]|nr:hypothetical protein GGI23_003549 [Coemansia sp. RSA 2559]KAJ2846728.1 hypothetical protein GGI22_006170 [Coemansia erecta]